MAQFSGKYVTGVSDNITRLTRVTELWMYINFFTEIPASVLVMTQLTILHVRRRSLRLRLRSHESICR